MTEPTTGPIADAALAALAEERAAEEAAREAERERLTVRARERAAEVLADKVDSTVLDAQVWVDSEVVVLSDGDTDLAVDAQQHVRLADIEDGQPTALSEPIRSLADLGRALERRR